MSQHARPSTPRRVAFLAFAFAVVATLVIPAQASGAATAPTTPSSDFSVATTFPDVPSGHPFATEIGWMVDRGITTGYPDGTFQPTALVTRQSIAAFLYRYKGSPLGSTPTCSVAPFPDVPTSHPFCGQIKWMVNEEIASGYPDGLFHPTDVVSRQSLSTFIYRLLGSPDGANPTCATAPFPDVPTSHPFCGEIKWAVSQSITSGYPDLGFHPSSAVSRQSAAAFLYRIPTAVVSLAAGRSHSCALFGNGTVKCWGDNTSGQLGDGTWDADPVTPPVIAKGVNTAVALTSGANHTCALLSSGSIKCWGAGSAGELGNGAGAESETPVTVSGITNATAIGSGSTSSHTCAVLTTHAIKCWGYNGYGQLGNGGTSFTSTPVTVTSLTNAESVATGTFSTCAVLTTHAIKCWGDNFYGQLGSGSYDPSLAPVQVSSITTASKVAVGDQHACASLTSGGVRCWGYNASGELGNGTATSNVPLTVGGGISATSVSAGQHLSCASLNGGGVKCWGGNPHGQLGNGTTAVGPTSTPATVSGVPSASLISAGESHACAQIAPVLVKCWGFNERRQLGDGTVTQRTTPVYVTGLYP